MSDFVVGDVYEIDCCFKICVDGAPPALPYFAKFIGYSSKNEPVFESNGRFFNVEKKWNKITKLSNGGVEK